MCLPHLQRYLDIPNEEEFRICFEYILSIKGIVTNDIINVAIENKENKPFLISSIGNFCDLNTIVKILIMLVLVDYKDNLIDGTKLREIISKYIDEIFQYNYLINEYDFTNVCFLMLLEKHLKLFKHIKSIENKGYEGTYDSENKM